jgi:hypothetical protein
MEQLSYIHFQLFCTSEIIPYIFLHNQLHTNYLEEYITDQEDLSEDLIEESLI